MTLKKIIFNAKLASGLVMTMALALGGCASTNKDDPWQGWNHGTQAFNDGLDKHVIKPLAKGYQWITPQIVEESVGNAFYNIDDIGVMLNDFLQLKVQQGGMDLARIIVNSTIGLGGLFDVGQAMGLPKHQEDFGQTLAVWGVPSGPYLVLPLYGPSSPRDTLGLIGDTLFNPLTYVSFGTNEATYSTMGAAFVRLIDRRAQMLSTGNMVDEATDDNRYDFIKNAYKQHRDYLISDGKSEQEDSLDKEFDSLDLGDKPAK